MKITILIFAIYGLMTFVYQIFYIIRKQKRISKMKRELKSKANG